MIKKYMGITFIAASLAVVGCSSNDDGDSMPTGDGNGDGGQQPAPIAVPQEYTPTDPDLAENLAERLTNLSAAGGDAPTFNTLLQAASDANLVDALTSADSLLTVFAPTDAAFAALEALPTGDALTDVLTYHIVSGALDATLVAASVGSSAVTLNGGSLAVTQDGADLKIGGAGFLDNGIIHVIDTVLIPAPATGGDGEADGMADGMADGEADGGADGSVAGPNLGPALNGLRDGGYTDYVTIHEASGLGTVYDENAWTAFIPNNDAIPDAALASDQGAAFDLLNNHIMTTGAFDAAGLIGQSPTTANGGAALTFGGTADALTVNGFSATPITIPGIAATLYVIDGVITP